jgi:hypothetical protein
MADQDRLFLSWVFNSGRPAPPATDIDACTRLIAANVPNGTTVEMVMTDGWHVGKALGPPPGGVGPGPYDTRPRDYKERLQRVLDDARLPAANFKPGGSKY